MSNNSKALSYESLSLDEFLGRQKEMPVPERDRAWIIDLRKRLRYNPQDRAALAEFQSERFRNLCRLLDVGPIEGRKALIDSIAHDDVRAKRSPQTPPDVPPMDDHNRALVDHVHPRDYVNPTPDGRYNLVVIGAGAAGLVSAAGAAGLGAKVALIERHLLGGDCLNVGCVPSKALIRAARVYADVRDAGEFGVVVPNGVSVDFPKVMERMRRLRARISSNDSVKRFTELGVDVYLGQATFTRRDTIQVGDRTLRFKKAVITTGARALELPIPGLKEAGALTNETLFTLTELPRRLGVIGAGPIGCEMAQAFARFGSEVYLFEGAEQILIREDSDAAKIVEQQMVRDGVNLICCSTVVGVATTSTGKVVKHERKGKVESIEFDEILVGVGRSPNVQGLGLETVGVEYDDRKGIKVNDRLQTTNSRIYAAGDICSRFKFTHTADAMARIVIGNALFKGRANVSALTIPWCTYTDPEIAHVGLYDKEAEEKGLKVKTFIQPLEDMDRAILDGEDAGFVKVHVQEGTDTILGATIVARHAGEMINEFTLAMVGGLGLGTIAKTIHPYPTQAEAVKRTGDAYNRTRLTPLVSGLMKKWLAWTR